jgi:hypothetical protein
MLRLLEDNQISRYFTVYLPQKGLSDSGFTVFLSGIYIIFGKGVIIPRLVFALFSAWMCLLIYNLAKRNFGESAARIAAIMAMLLPNFIYYTGMHLKETIMTFLLVAFIERSDKLLRSKVITLGRIALVIFLGGSLFFFRTVLGAVAILSVMVTILFSSKRLMKSSTRMVIGAVFLFAGVFAFTNIFQEEINYYLQSRDTNQELQMSSYAYRGQTYAQYGRTYLFLPVILFAPFPTMVDTQQPNTMIINGAVFTRNVYAFFVLAGLIILFRNRLLRNHILILSVTLTYLIILASSGFALSERFHVPILPFLLILAGYGITRLNQIRPNYFTIYMAVIVVLVIGWNWFKLAGRGLV